MKKIIITCMFIAAPLFIFAQLKVFNNGYVSLLSSSTQALSPISINCPGDTSYYVTAKGTNKNGLNTEITNTEAQGRYAGYFKTESTSSLTSNSYGVRADTYVSSNTILSRSFAIIGNANSGGRAIGVLGRINTTGRGAAIYGTTYNEWGASLPSGEIYAGFFNGNVKVTGDLYLNGSIRGLYLGDASNNFINENNSQKTKGSLMSISERLVQLQATTYQKNKPLVDIQEDIDSDLYNDTDERYTPQTNVIEEQFYSKSHYALSAEQLENIFPELVYVHEDGSKSINYVEMIPLLVQTINELNCRISALESEDDVATDERARVAALDVRTTTSNTASLAQNTPNPFTERTTIRFSLPDDTKKAYIYIFDMTGKMQKQIPVDASMQSITINGYELSAGMYIYSLVVNGKEMDTKRMILSK